MNSDELRAAVAQTAPLLRTAALFALAGALLLLVPSWYMLEVYDRVVGSRSHSTLAMLTLLAVAAYLVMEVMDWAAASVLRAAGARFERQLTPRVFDACFAARLRKLPAGSLQPLQDLHLLHVFFPGPAVRAALELPVAAVFLAVVAAIHPLLGWLTLGGALVQAAVAWANERSTAQRLVAANRAAREAQLQVDASLRNAQVIEAMGMLPDIHRRWMQRQRDYLALQSLASDHAGTWQAASRFVQTTMASALLGVAAWLILRGELHNGGGLMIVASTLGGRVLAPLVTLIAQWRSVAGARDAWQRLSRLLAALPAATPAMALPAPSGRFAAENLVVPVPGTGIPVLRGVRFALEPGEVLAVVGPSAAGKTTLARALVGLWPSTGGRARLDGVDVAAWDKAELGPHLGYLPQAVELFDGTVADNIARFDTPDPASVEAAARKVGLHDTILALPQGYATEIGSDGARLSGGQRQRLALARALYGDPVFVVLDEPNASLDEAGERALAEAIAAGKARGTTFVVITHRTSILAVSDKMLVLADGQMQGFGPRDKVLAALQVANGDTRRQGEPPRSPAAARPGVLGWPTRQEEA
ncbi:type I secretion system permease/ATPase [Ramlibacter alkalitolerans]|uniref:Type I secretion system permease/ATPase n=1 Tax=Ramlibacter alkalitolerans TaxID=2039631 RepID=A0ABS1JMC9_9BURK|nr:type I secretion system permease/ATPase [Ramlibacter alkalitolerans]MBL0425395.1 type I secretion system permease/ATPase [Ramlibacter alkalitolerans]